MAEQRSTSNDAPVIVLFRHDLRISDNRALYAAAGTGKPVIPVFLWDEQAEQARAIGGARQWWLHHSLTGLHTSLRSIGADLLLKRGLTQDIVDALIEETGADMVLWNRRYDPPGVETDKVLKAELGQRDIAAESFDGHLLHEPYLFKTGSGGFYRVYSPFWRAFTVGPEPRDPVPAPKKLRPYQGKTSTDRLDNWGLLPNRPDWAKGFAKDWTPGEAGAHQRLADFLDGAIAAYKHDRDKPAIEATSRLSPHLAHGEITPFQIWRALKSPELADEGEGVEKFRREIGWREFSYHLLFNNPQLATKNYNASFDNFTWRNAPDHLAAWQQGQTGYPIVDAGMRQLWQTGWMHNRVRMITASFLIKHLRVDWRRGEEWFWDTLVDADPASNAASWQWVAGSGADAAPYFRIFNPMLQGDKFDPRGGYIREFVPELKHLPDKYLHAPWLAPEAVLKDAKVSLGETYPQPIVDHQAARQQALIAYAETRKTSEPI
ncbi:deoxyribodipyrimidine photo-lyase (plasmid) [Phyllobacterium sp. 628]|uniref:cryptochrome/photolyase family protein n=1 Tax=Phyllobacterium sp. 628 TaxID=2718938 RepID=UPI0016625E1A|nr:deoxyribodipyrimidine photo-lyase [Phyllobacterium sp. 628]QND54904.1 deoxyribodipyrimidine photo-lyase [Phyllobacterium sp. 628]